MDSLLKAVRKSPKPFGRSSAASKASKHKKLGEHWGEDNQQVKEGVTFYLKYLGSTLVEELEEEGVSYGDTISPDAVKTIVNMAKMSGKKLEKVAVTVSMEGIKVHNEATKDIRTDLPIYRICFCTADRFHDKVFAYIARSTENETIECHAFQCATRKIAQAVTLTVARSFKTAQDEWELEDTKNLTQKLGEVELSDDLSHDQSHDLSHDLSQSHDLVGNTEHDDNYRFEDDFILSYKFNGVHDHNAFTDNLVIPATNDQKQADNRFEDDFNVEDDFSSLAESRSVRTRPSPFSRFNTGLTEEDLEEGVQQLLSNLNHQPHSPDLLGL